LINKNEKEGLVMPDITPELGEKYFFRWEGDLLLGMVVQIIFDRNLAIFQLPSKKKLSVPFFMIERTA